ncbi:MAG: hypothetical protein WBB00_07140 [Mycobacterium sp.]
MSRRLNVVLPMAYDDARARYEKIVPTYDPSAFTGAKSWDDTLGIAGVQAPHGFMLYARFDAAPMMVGSPSRGRATEYLMGNHTIAETMFRYDPGVLLHAPLRTLISVGDDGVTRFSVDQPSLQFASFGRPEIAAVGHRLDALLAGVIALLGGDVPEQLESPAHQVGPS